MKPKFEITGEGSDLRLNFTFQGQKYSIPNGTSDPNKLVFQQSTNTGDTESAVILVEGQIENDQYNGIAQFKIKKNVSIVTAKDSKKWSPHRYDCDVTYNFQGKPTTIK
jgi:hypothetical protein